MGEKTMTALERTQKVINDLQKEGIIPNRKPWTWTILHKVMEEKEIFVIHAYNDIQVANIIKYAIRAEFREITLSFTCVKEAVAFTIKS